jgi:hypothetical protein
MRNIMLITSAFVFGLVACETTPADTETGVVWEIDGQQDDDMVGDVVEPVAQAKVVPVIGFMTPQGALDEITYHPGDKARLTADAVVSVDGRMFEGGERGLRGVDRCGWPAR